jgi:hypothetical protein
VRDAIVISGWTWEALNVPERLALSLAHAGARVLYCENPISLFRPSEASVTPVKRNIFRFRPTFVSDRLNQLRLFSRFQAVLLANQILRSANRLGLKDPVLFYPHGHYSLALSSEMKRRGFDLVHICMDYEIKEQIEHVRLSDVTLAIPEAAFLELQNLFGGKVYKLPQFAAPSTIQPGTLFADESSMTYQRDLGNNRLIYLGNVEGRVDLSLLNQLLREHPEWHFISFGARECLALPNSHVLPWGDPDVLTHLCSPYSVGFLPYDCAEPKNMHCVPLKLFDYFSRGLPVVSTPIAFSRLHEELVYTGGTVQEIADAVVQALQEPTNSPKKSKRISLAAEHSIEKLSEFLSPLLSQTTQFPPPDWSRSVGHD